MTSEYDTWVPDSSSQPERPKQLPDSFEIPSALPSVLARVFAFSTIVAGSLCGGLMGFALGRLQWGTDGDLWVFWFLSRVSGHISWGRDCCCSSS